MEIPVPRIPLGDWIEVILDWLLATLGGFFTVIRNFLEDLYELLLWVLMTPEWWIITIVLAGLGWWLRSWQLALGTVIGFILIVGVNQWENAMSTLSLVTIATLIAVVIAIPLGILGAKSYTASKILRPVMDFMQTMPPMVYLIPALVIFRVGVVPGMVATVIFAMAPGVRFTELGIRGVDSEVVEAGKAFGSTPGKILRQIQLPLAMPTIMAGVNQVIMLSLSMVVIAGMVGAGGLGGEVVASLNRINAGLGFESGLAVVILAMYLDRLTSIQAKT
ncbi:MAG: ABC transporter permease subunit [Yaniella sp.]|uniref:ABC transporter permease n=1 Tax=Yaniella sp. TaxID=2773929 RepID=UPI00264A1B4A|nr:ABC transporter permease subunit [Yaniella sp.]MDN6151846.1 ABC transporter permease subunit [Yaniella sp.]MDN6350752.1 ABC transporter permease subunit [Yaniella sp.]MDN6357665.1 ABC transporter permease subunit [Yaniella sp.]MDN6410556.1 ABC transporter permease subunit [Yaniella sp.]MDN6456024.1 ABC transporter permease subunit [Yaniella sp.]